MAYMHRSQYARNGSGQNRNNLAVRRYRPNDKEEVKRLFKVALEAAGVWKYKDLSNLHNPGKDGSDLDNIEGVYLGNGKGEFLVGEADGRIAAMGGIRRVSDEVAELKRMMVDPDCQRRGYAQLILAALESRARALVYKKIILDTTILQTAARALYLKNGYRETRRERVEKFDTVLLYFEKEL